MLFHKIWKNKRSDKICPYFSCSIILRIVQK
jgi:hypothetical protein